LAAGREVKIIDVARMVNEVTGNKAGIEFKQRRKWDTKPRLLASIDKARKLIEYEPLITDFKEGFEKTIEWFKDFWKEIELSADFPPGMSSAVRDAKGICGVNLK